MLPRICPGCRSLDGEHDFGPGCTLNEEAPYVCPGCHAVAEPCLPGCIDAEIEAERREAQESGDYDISEDDDDIEV